MITSQQVEQVFKLINRSDCNKVFYISRNHFFREIPYQAIPGIYILSNKDEIVYIGSTKNIFQRVLNHKRAIPYQKKNDKTNEMGYVNVYCYACRS